MRYFLFLSFPRNLYTKKLHGRTCLSIWNHCAAEVVVSPPYVFLPVVKSQLRPEIQVAAQNCWVKKGGAFTGEVRLVISSVSVVHPTCCNDHQKVSYKPTCRKMRHYAVWLGLIFNITQKQCHLFKLACHLFKLACLHLVLHVACCYICSVTVSVVWLAVSIAVLAFRRGYKPFTIELIFCLSWLLIYYF